MGGPTEAQMVIWRRFSNKYPEAAKKINAEARETNAHNTKVARTMAHGASGLFTRFNHASVLRTNIANGYLPEDTWRFYARGYTKS